MSNVVFVIMLLSIFMLGACVPGVVRFIRDKVKAARARRVQAATPTVIAYDDSALITASNANSKNIEEVRSQVDQLNAKFGELDKAAGERVGAIETFAKNAKSRIEVIEKKLGTVEMDSFGHLVENPTIVDDHTIKSETKKLEPEDDPDSWKTL